MSPERPLLFLLLVGCARVSLPPGAPPQPGTLPDVWLEAPRTWYARARHAEVVGDTEAQLRAAAWVARLDRGDGAGRRAALRLALDAGDEQAARRFATGARSAQPDDAWLRWVQRALDAGLGVEVASLRAASDALDALPATARAELGVALVQVAADAPPPDAWAVIAELALGLGESELALAAAERVFSWVPTPEGLARWVRAADAACQPWRPAAWWVAAGAASWGAPWLLPAPEAEGCALPPACAELPALRAAVEAAPHARAARAALHDGHVACGAPPASQR